MPSDRISAEIGRNVRAEMGRRRVNMSELARRTGIPRTTLMHQMDVTSLTVNTLMAIAEALDIAPGDLLDITADQASA